MISILNSRDPDTMEAEHQDIIVENYTGAETVVGDTVCFVTGANADGKRVEVASSTNISAFAGVCREAKGTSYGVLVRSKGFIDQAQYLATTDLKPGDGLVPVATKPYLARSGASDGTPYFAVYASNGTTTAASTALDQVILYGW